MPRPALLLAIGLSATMAMAAEVGKGKGDGKDEGGKGVVSAVGTALKPTKEDEDKDKGCWWEQREDKEDKVKECARDDNLSGRYTPDMCAGFKKKGYCTTGKYAGWMQTNCFTTCNGCCADINKHCPRWAKEGYCNKGGSRQEWMTRNCRKSCRVCCGDDDWDCKIQHMGRKMKAMGMKFKEVMTQAEKDRFRLMEKMDDKVKEVQETMKAKLGWLANSLQECGCNVTRPEKPEKGWACEACSGPEEEYWKCGGCSMIQQEKPDNWICRACQEMGAGFVCKLCKHLRPDGFTKPEKPEMTKPQGKPTKPGKPEVTRPQGKPTKKPVAKPTRKPGMPTKPSDVKPYKPSDG